MSANESDRTLSFFLFFFRAFVSRAYERVRVVMGKVSTRARSEDEDAVGLTGRRANADASARRRRRMRGRRTERGGAMKTEG